MGIQPQRSRVSGVAYLVLEPIVSSWGEDEYGNAIITGVKVVAVKQNRPRSLVRNQSVVRITVQVDPKAFLPLSSNVTVILPEVNDGDLSIEAEQ